MKPRKRRLSPEEKMKVDRAATAATAALRAAAFTPESAPLPDFDNATAYVVGHRVGTAIENVVAVYGNRGKELVARGYLSFDEARKLRDALTKAIGP